MRRLCASLLVALAALQAPLAHAQDSSPKPSVAEIVGAARDLRQKGQAAEQAASSSAGRAAADQVRRSGDVRSMKDILGATGQVRSAVDDTARRLPQQPNTERSLELASEVADAVGHTDPQALTNGSRGSEAAIRASRSVSPLPQIGGHRPNNLLKAPTPGSPTVYIFISQSQPDADIRAALDVASQYGATAYLRGILPGSTLDKGALRVQVQASKVQPEPDFAIDPRPFQQFEVETVPTVVVSSGVNHFVKVSGTLSVQYALDRFKAGQEGDLGSRGQTFAVLEPDLIEDFKARIMGIDWDAKKRGASRRLFKSINVISLPKATESLTRYVDPSVELANDIATPDGRVLAVAGTRFNPLTAFGMSRQIVVFDATDLKQRAYAKALADFDLKLNLVTVLITTEVDRERGMESFKEIAAALKPHRVFVLDEVVQQRLDLRVVPSIAKAEGDKLVVREIGPEVIQ